MEKLMKDSGGLKRCMEMAYTRLLMALLTMDSGRIIMLKGMV